MAANEYYNAPAAASARPPVDYNAPLPPVPSSPSMKPSATDSPGMHGQPVTSPFDDHTYPGTPDFIDDTRNQGYSQAHSSQPYQGSNADYYGVGGGPGDPHGPNPFADDIPLKTHASQGTTEYQPGQANQLYNPEPDVAAADMETGRKRRKGRSSRFFHSKGRTPWFVYIMTVIQVAVFIGEIVRNSILTGSPIMIKPQFNPMIGPSPQVQINMGARYVPCMRSTPNVQNSTDPVVFSCPNTTSSDPNNPSNRCSLSQLCGFSGVPDPKPGGKLSDKPQPNQWFRFIIPIFLHAGLIHISFNMLLQLTLGRDMEKAIGPLRLALVYFSSGIFGFVLGGNFAAPGIASTGASGCLFGILAINLLDLLYSWKERRSPMKELAYIMLDIVISFILGLLPGLDNFSHIGGFLMGLVLGICLLHSPSALRQRIGQGEPPYRPVTTDAKTAITGFVKRPLGFFKGRKPLWWVWWLFRAGALIGVLVGFIVLLGDFYKYYETRCGWCKYLSCLPINNWCELGNLHLTKSPAKRDLSSFF